MTVFHPAVVLQSVLTPSGAVRGLVVISAPEVVRRCRSLWNLLLKHYVLHSLNWLTAFSFA